jgi:hypothetical protein
VGLQESLTYRKILLHGTSGFTFHPKECVLRIFIAFKNPSPRPSSNLRLLGPAASTLTTTPQRRQDMGIDGNIILKWILQKRRCEAVDWIELAQDMFAVLKTVINKVSYIVSMTTFFTDFIDSYHTPFHLIYRHQWRPHACVYICSVISVLAT